MFAGCISLQVRDPLRDLAIPVVVLYPTAASAIAVPFGPYSMEVAPEAPLAAGSRPLVIVSHGSGGSHLLYRELATHLARCGYVVALPEHPGNNRNDNALEGTPRNLVDRPRHLSLVIDALVADPRIGPGLQVGSVAVVGHSMGGYTALALAGGQPSTEDRQPLDVTPDARVKALVLLAPATAWFMAPGALRRVDVPILMLSAEHDSFTPGWHADIVRHGVAGRGQLVARVVKNAGHFSFLSPFPAALRRPGFLPATDPEGFDREAFHARLPAEIGDFLDTRLPAG
jgi:predicted dienelactone hydrolase